jgi:trimeric autotransporter adhesin
MPDAVFGRSVAMAGTTVVIGASGEASAATGVNGDQDSRTAPGAGAAYVFTRADAGWSQQAYLKASNTESTDGFGWTVAVDGDTAVVSAFRESSNATGVNGDQTNNQARYAGAAYVFARTGTTWSQQAYLKASNTQAYDYFGESVALAGDTLVIGAAREDSAATGVNGDQSNNAAFSAGAAYVFTRTDAGWSQQAYLKASNTDAEDAFGSSVAVTGDTIVVGAPGEASAATGINGDQTNNVLFYAGAAYVFERTDTTWIQQAYLKASNTEHDLFGSSLAVLGTTLIVGAPFEDSTATGVNGDQTNNSASESGAAYVFDLAPAPPPTATPTATPATATAVTATSVATIPPSVTPFATATAPSLTVTVQSPTPAPLLDRLYLPRLLTE